MQLNVLSWPSSPAVPVNFLWSCPLNMVTVHVSVLKGRRDGAKSLLSGEILIKPVGCSGRRGRNLGIYSFLKNS